ARSTDPQDYQRVPRPVAAMAKDFPDGFHIAPHSHEPAQLIFAAEGAMLVSTREGTWAVPPQRAVWMPGGVTHEIRMAGAVAMRTLYVRNDAAPHLPARVRVLAVSALLRELILRACELPVRYDEAGPAGRLMTLILDEIAALPTLALDLPMPRDPRLARICRALRAEPGDTRTTEPWARGAGASPPSLASSGSNPAPPSRDGVSRRGSSPRWRCSPPASPSRGSPSTWATTRPRPSPRCFTARW